MIVKNKPERYEVLLKNLRNYYDLWRFPAKIDHSFDFLKIPQEVISRSFSSSHFIATLAANREQCNKGAEWI